MQQNTDQWLEWRRKGLGASDACIIMNKSPWKTPFQLWEEKLGLGEKFEGNFATEFGHRMEPKIRADFELRYGFEAPPVLAVHEEYKFLKASLDGYNDKLNVVLEIKAPGRVDHATAKSGSRSSLRAEKLVGMLAQIYGKFSLAELP